MKECYRLEEELKNKSGIYMWTSPSGKSYIGQSKDLGGRHKDFRCATKGRTYAGKKSVIDKARQKYPYQEWKYRIIEFCDIEQLDEKEKKYIQEYNTLSPNGYNTTKGGIGGCGVPKSAFKKGHKETEEDKRKRLETLKKHIEEGVVSFDSRSKPIALYNIDGMLINIFKSLVEFCKYFGLSGFNVNYHIKHNNKFRNRYMVRFAEENTPLFIEPHYKPKRKMSAELIEKLRKAHLGKKLPSKYVAVIATNENTGEVFRYESIKEAAKNVWPENTKTAEKNISEAINGRRRVAYGFFWNKEGETIEHREKKSIKGIKFSAERRQRMSEMAFESGKCKPVKCYKYEGMEYIETLQSIKEAELKYDSRHIHHCCSGIQRKIKSGFTFRYA